MADSSRTEKPTPRRLQKAREEGRFATSREFVAGVQFTMFVVLLGAFGAESFDGLGRMLRQFIVQAFQRDLSVSSLTAQIHRLILPNLVTLGFVAAALVLTTMAAQLLTTQLGIATAQLAPDFGRLNPIRRLSSLPRQNLPALVQAVLLLPVFGFAVWGIVRANLDDFLTLPLATVTAASARVVGALHSLLWRAALVFFVLGAIDLYRQRRRYMTDLKMSQHEIREEHKDQEGNPHTKMRIRRLQRDLLRRNMMKEIPNATAVVVNPTHYAIAIRYSLDSMGAPTIVAKGKNYLALRIKQRAIDNDVPIIENPPLAQALYKSVDIGQEIPPNLYRAVAEVLAYVFRLSHGGRA
jgi:flagellar biosynthetic protein FlhB